MKRVHLFELEDQKWMPAFLRNFVTDFLQFMSNKLKVYEPIIPVLEKALKESNTNQIIDLGSGGGGGLLWLNTALQERIPDLKITLTDYYPNIAAFEYTKQQADNINYVDKPIDARNIPPDLKGVRTQFLSLHHFRPKDALKILQNAVDSNSPIAIFEAQERSVSNFIGMLLSPIMVLLMTPFIRPFKLDRIFFTYLLPLIPLIVLWDGLVSVLRTYSVKEMDELINQLEKKEQFNWETARLKTPKGVILYLLALPNAKKEQEQSLLKDRKRNFASV